MNPTTKYLVLTGILIPVVGVAILWLRNRVEARARREVQEIELQGRKESQEVDALAAPIAILKAELAKREGELSEARRLDREDRGRLIEALTAVKTTMEELATDLREHRTEERERAAAFHVKLNEVDTRLVAIETHLNVKRPT